MVLATERLGGCFAVSHFCCYAYNGLFKLRFEFVYFIERHKSLFRTFSRHIESFVIKVLDANGNYLFDRPNTEKAAKAEA